jgi:hypothetical protein
MIEYCITFITDDEEPREVWHCHVTAPIDALALEVALKQAAQDNVSLLGARAVALSMIRELPADLMQSLEAVRVAVHGATTAPQQASAHLH